MTNRRSFQTNAARYSRQAQFVPGHVGGRVASAQPVRRRAAVGATGNIPGLPPDTVVANADRDVTDTNYTVTIPALSTAYSSAVALVIGYGYTDLSLPAGWRTLLSGSHGVNGTNGGRISDYHLLVCESPAASVGTAFTYATQEYDLLTTGTAWAYAYFTGGQGGAWAGIAGPTYSGTPTAGFAGVGAAEAWFQCGALSAIYTNGTVPVGVQVRGNAGGVYAFPGVSSDGAIAGIVAKTASEVINYNTAGAAGTPNSVAVAAVWTP